MNTTTRNGIPLRFLCTHLIRSLCLHVCVVPTNVYQNLINDNTNSHLTSLIERFFTIVWHDWTVNRKLGFLFVYVSFPIHNRMHNKNHWLNHEKQRHRNFWFAFYLCTLIYSYFHFDFASFSRLNKTIDKKVVYERVWIVNVINYKYAQFN